MEPLLNRPQLVAGSDREHLVTGAQHGAPLRDEDPRAAGDQGHGRTGWQPKLVNLDKNRQEVTLTGWVRPQDVSAQNAVESSRIANAEIVYAGKGDLGKPKSGILGRVLGMVWP